jgi:hypothetical protein
MTKAFRQWPLPLLVALASCASEDRNVGEPFDPNAAGHPAAMEVDEESNDCPATTCRDAVRVLIERETWPNATYDVTVTVNGANMRCTGQVASSNQVGELQCSSGLTAAFGSAVGCEGDESDGKPRNCHGLNLSRLELGFSNLSDSVMLSISQDGRIVFEESLAPEYENLRPFGPLCGGCRVGTAQARL